MKIVTNQEARQGKNTMYRQILAASLWSIRSIGTPATGKLRYYAVTYWTAIDGVVGLVVFDRKEGKWTHAEARFYTGNGDEIEARIINLS